MLTKRIFCMTLILQIDFDVSEPATLSSLHSFKLASFTINSNTTITTIANGRGLLWYKSASPPHTDSWIVFAKWCHVPRCNTCFLRPTQSTTQTAPRSVQPFLQGSRLCQTDTQTDNYHARRSVITGRIYVRSTAMRSNNNVISVTPRYGWKKTIVVEATRDAPCHLEVLLNQSRQYDC